MVGVPVRVHSRHGDDLGIAHVPPPVGIGDVLELRHGPILLLLRVVDLVETGQPSPLAALVKGVARADVRPLAARGELLRIEVREREAGGLTYLRVLADGASHQRKGPHPWNPS